ncbi:MAG: hypothetical protein V3S19_07890 [Gemmatimonadales bacterium]
MKAIIASVGGRAPPAVSNFMPPDAFENWLDSGRDILLTDDYAPVDNMLAPVALAGESTSAQRHYNSGFGLEAQGRLEEAIAEHDAAIAVDLGFALAFNNRGAYTVVWVSCNWRSRTSMRPSGSIPGTRWPTSIGDWPTTPPGR